MASAPNTTLMIPPGFAKGAISTKFKDTGAGDELGAGIKSGFGIIGYKGKVWSTKFQGKETALMRDDGDGARASIEVIIVRAAEAISKIYYEAGFVDGSVAPPDCWSTNGVTPDGAAPKKQSSTCAGCPKNAWGSKITDAGKQAKACADSKRLAVVPLNDPKNEAMGGPMLLRNPAASLKDLKAYGDELRGYGYPYYAVATRISFDVTEAFPKFVFSAIRPLKDDEAEIVLELRDSPAALSILNESVEIVHHEPDQVVPKTPFETAQAGPAQTAAQAQVQAPNTPAPAVQAPATPAAETGEAGKSRRPRRTKAEMEAAAAELAAKRNGGAPAAAPQPAVAPAANEGGAAPANFDAALDALMKT